MVEPGTEAYDHDDERTDRHTSPRDDADPAAAAGDRGLLHIDRRSTVRRGGRWCAPASTRWGYPDVARLASQRMDRLGGKVALITGRSAGLGRVGAELFAARALFSSPIATTVTTSSRRSRRRWRGVVRATTSCAERPRRRRAHGGHVRRAARALQRRRHSPCHDGGPEETADKTWAEVLDVNVTGVARCCRHGSPMLASGGGSIVNVASFVAHMGAATPQIAYTASKGAVVAMTREVATIYARRGIRANALCPGPVLTPLLAKFLSDEARRQRRLVHIPMGRFGEPIEIASGALFLASDESSFMTGQSLISTAASQPPTPHRSDRASGGGWWSCFSLGDEVVHAFRAVLFHAPPSGFVDQVGRSTVLEVGLAIVRLALQVAARSSVTPPSAWGTRWLTSQWVIGASQPAGCWQWRSRTWIARRSMPRVRGGGREHCVGAVEDERLHLAAPEMGYDQFGGDHDPSRQLAHVPDGPLAGEDAHNGSGRRRLRRRL